MTGRFTQLGRQLRKLRHISGGSGADPATTVRRAIQLASDLACEQTQVDDPPAAFRAVTTIDTALAERLAGYASDVTATIEDPLAVGADLDRFLRSLELGAPAAAIPFEAITPRERAKADSTSAITISGRVIELEVTRGHAAIAIDDRPIAMSLPSGDAVASVPLATAPTSKPEIQREPSGATRVAWTLENVVIEIAADFASARIQT